MAEEKKITLEEAADAYDRTQPYKVIPAEAFKAGAEWQKEQLLRIAKDRYEQAMTFVTGNSKVDQAIQMDRLALVKIIEEDKK